MIRYRIAMKLNPSCNEIDTCNEIGTNNEMNDIQLQWYEIYTSNEWNMHQQWNRIDISNEMK